MKTNKIVFTLIALLLAGGELFSQNWQLVWSDEFTNGISADWVYDNGAGGWGNNEQEYYRPQNATVQNGQLLITAKNESFGGANYTSARMKTQGKKSWTYGKIVARIALPGFQGSWPAFWMLGDNISSVGWPACGEIDIMEQINTSGTVYGSTHWKDQNGNQADFTNSVGTSITTFHEYSIEWTSSYIRWFVDGNKYNEINIANNAGSTEEFQRSFFLILNLAVGGNWPGFSINNGALPSSMLVDYVRVYQDAGGTNNSGTGVTNLSGSYQIRNRFSGMNIDINAASTADGARVQQYTPNGCTCQNFKFTHLGNGVYEITADHSGKSLDVSNISTADGAALVQWPYWGGTNQQFKAVSTGDGYFKLVAQHSGKIIEEGGWSTTAGTVIQQWTDNGQSSGQWQLIPVTAAFSKTIQAESYSAMLGVQLENTTDAGGGQDVGYIDAGDWMAYNNINFPTSGSYTVEYRVASISGSKLSMDLNAGSIQLGAVNIPATGGWQNWTTVTQNVNVNAGTYNVGLYAQAGGWNINWIRITKNGNARMGTLDAEPTTDDVSSNYNLGNDVGIFPNPIEGELRFISGVDLGGGTARIISDMGVEVVNTSISSDKIDVSSLNAGIYTILINKDGNSFSKRFVKK
jgi:beta-glucanase (GH16 family)